MDQFLAGLGQVLSGNVTLAGLLAFIILMIVIGAFRRWWVPGSLYKESQEALRASEATREKQNALIFQMAASFKTQDDFFQKVGEAVVSGKPVPQKRDKGGTDVVA